MAETNNSHEHIDFTAASMVTARQCSSCGAYVSGEGAAGHQEFHDRVRTLEGLLLAPVVPEEAVQLEMFGSD